MLHSSISTLSYLGDKNRPVDEEMATAYSVNNSEEITEELISDTKAELHALNTARPACSQFEKLAQLDRYLSEII